MSPGSQSQTERVQANGPAGVRDNAIQVFEFGGWKVRTAGTLDAPLFCAADVCAALGILNARDACSSLPAKDRMSVKATPGKSPQVFITEAGLYKLVMRSRKLEAESFVDWVTSEVLPEIRKRGYYNALEVQQRKQTELLLAQCFPNLPTKSKPIFSELIASLLRLRREVGAPTNPPWARSLASDVYRWAIHVEGQQPARRERNPKPNGSSTDHSMFSELASSAVTRVVHGGCDFARASVSWQDWKAKMELIYGTKALQMQLLVPMLEASRGRGRTIK